MTGASAAALAQRLIDEGLRMADHPGVIFKDGPSGRRAALAFGPDIWEVIKFLREVDERGLAAINAAAEVFALDASRISAAISYYGDYSDEIDAEISAELRALGHDVIAIADRPDLRSKSDDGVFAWASTGKRWLLTENVKDFRPIMLRALQAGPPGCGLLFTSSRAFPRSRKNPGPLIRALHAWLTAGPPAPPVTESWLLGAADL